MPVLVFPAVSSVLVPLVTAALLAPGQVKLTAKPGGKMTYDHGSPVWRDEFQSALTPGQTWRFGANGPTTWTTEAGLLFDDLVVFPGTYNIAAAPQAVDTWHLIFHHDGIQYQNATGEGHTVLDETEVREKEFANSLTVEIEPNKDAGKGVYRFQATFGPRRMAGNFKTAKAKTLKAKVGKSKVESTYLLRTDVEELQGALEQGPVALARIEVTPRKGDPRAFRAFVEGGDTPLLTLVAPGKTLAASKAISGQAGTASATDEVGHTIDATDAGVDLVFEVGEHAYHFPLTEADLDGE